ncbi:hypothetical protein SH580_20705 [Coraliomargarita algicola]|uniref:Outer membrane lipoprotein BamD-like domain-containing protein n=1 Tax=Coraliomargarita algicola TaxID=3092156 RepID=A0ABZ0RL13_9BACT|nr:hypothetical protein [Coraliomargarita sp. J2-16]WPJ95841.1 hypothetical protein SH580_20705 [Coraliomargarita sp. J2-16]
MPLIVLPSRLQNTKIALPVFASILALCHLTGCNDSSQSQEDTVEAGFEALKYYDYNLAETKFNQAQSDLSPDDQEWTKITFSAAIASWHSSPPSGTSIDHAQSLFEEIVEKSEDAQVVAMAKVNLARIAEVADFPNDTVDLAKAQSLYEEVMTSAEGTDIAAEATMRLAQTHVQSLTEDGVQRAISLLENFLKNNPDSAWQSVAAQYLGDLYFERLADPAAALKAYQIAEAAGFANDTKAHIYIWRMSRFARLAGDQRLSAEYCKQLVENFPRSQYGWVAVKSIKEYNEAHPENAMAVPSIQNAFRGAPEQ